MYVYAGIPLCGEPRQRLKKVAVGSTHGIQETLCARPVYRSNKISSSTYCSTEIRSLCGGCFAIRGLLPTATLLPPLTRFVRQAPVEE